MIEEQLANMIEKVANVAITELLNFQVLGKECISAGAGDAMFRNRPLR